MCGVNYIFCLYIFVEYFSRVDVINNELFDYHMNGHVPTLITKLSRSSMNGNLIVVNRNSRLCLDA